MSSGGRHQTTSRTELAGISLPYPAGCCGPWSRRGQGPPDGVRDRTGPRTARLASEDSDPTGRRTRIARASTRPREVPEGRWALLDCVRPGMGRPDLHLGVWPQITMASAANTTAARRPAPQRPARSVRAERFCLHQACPATTILALRSCLRPRIGRNAPSGGRGPSRHGGWRTAGCGAMTPAAVPLA